MTLSRLRCWCCSRDTGVCLSPPAAKREGSDREEGDLGRAECPRSSVPTWRPEVPEGHLLRLHLPGHVLRHALVDALVRLPSVLDHEGPVIQQVQAGIRLHAQLIAIMKDPAGAGPQSTGNTQSSPGVWSQPRDPGLKARTTGGARETSPPLCIPSREEQEGSVGGGGKVRVGRQPGAPGVPGRLGPGAQHPSDSWDPEFSTRLMAGTQRPQHPVQYPQHPV